jgi:hypothetical protein
MASDEPKQPPRWTFGSERAALLATTTYDNARVGDISELLLAGDNLVQEETPLSIVDHTATVITLATLRFILLNMRLESVLFKYPAIHARLCEFTLGERKRVLTLLSEIDGYLDGTIPHCLGCMKLSKDAEARKWFNFESGARVTIARALRWMCDNTVNDHLGREFYLVNTCKTMHCVNPQHYQRSQKHRGPTEEELQESLRLDDSHDMLRQYTAERDQSWVESERELARTSYILSPIEQMLARGNDDLFDPTMALDVAAALASDTDSMSTGTFDTQLLHLTSKKIWQKRVMPASPADAKPAVNQCK